MADERGVRHKAGCVASKLERDLIKVKTEGRRQKLMESAIKMVVQNVW